MPAYNKDMTPPPKKNHRWIWFFVVVLVLAIAASVVLVAFNLQQQLRPEQLAAARALWKEKGPRDYTLSYYMQVNDRNEDRYDVQVRSGRVVESFYNGKPEPPERFPYRGMEGLFDIVERNMEKDSAPNRPKVFVRAIFDDRKTGGLRWYVRSVMGERHREEITISTFTIDAS
jgi:hypothetical protein